MSHFKLLYKNENNSIDLDEMRIQDCQCCCFCSCTPSLFHSETIFFNVQNDDDIERLLVIVNEILRKYQIMKGLSIFKISINSLLLNFLEKERINDYLNVIDEAKRSFHFEDIKKLITIFKVIYSNKNKISREQIKLFAESIYDILKNERKLNLNNDKINFLKLKIEGIFSNNIENENYIINDSLIDSSNKETNILNEESIENFIDDLEKKSIKSLESFSSYSKESQKQIMKLEKKIKQLESKNNNADEKTLMKFKFIDKENNNYTVNFRIGKNDKFSSVVDKFYENYPEMEEIGIKRFIYKGQRIKRNQLIMDIGLDELSANNIEIQY